MVSKIRIDQSKKTCITQQFLEKFCYRYAYDKSADSIRSGSTGQDYLAINAAKNRVAFVLCDGVSQSFFGDLAARLLGDALIDWLWDLGDSIFDPGIDIEIKIGSFLDQLTEKGQFEVSEFLLPDGLPAMLTSVLEKKRALGSETTFTAGYFDSAKFKIFLAWMGDSRIRVWDSNIELTDALLNQENFQTKERWSTHNGRVGSLHSVSVSTSNIRRLMAYSDGLARLDTTINTNSPSHQTLSRLITESKYFPASDDVSFFELFFGSDPKWVSPHPPPPNHLEIVKNYKNKKLSVSWQPLSSVLKYELVISSNSGWRIFTVDGPKWSKDFNDLPQGTIMMAVRSWVGEEVSDWCKSQQIELPALSYKVASIKPGTSANTANQNFEEVFTFKEEQIDALVSKELPIHPQTQQKPFWKKLLPVILLLLFIILVIVIFSVVLSILFPLYKSQDIAIL